MILPWVHKKGGVGDPALQADPSRTAQLPSFASSASTSAACLSVAAL